MTGGDGIASCVAGACSESQLERSRNLSSLGLRLKAGGCDAEAVRALWEAVRVNTAGATWEARLGGIEIARLLVQHAGAHGCGAKLDTRHGSFATMDIQMFLSLLEDPEVRVRKAVGELLGEISRVSLLLRSPEVTGTVYVWEEVGPRILESIERNYSREEQSVTSDGCDPAEDPEALEILDPVSSLLQQSYKAVRPGVGEMRHDTEGWRCLETSFAALNAIMVGYGPAFGKYIVAGEEGGDGDGDGGEARAEDDRGSRGGLGAYASYSMTGLIFKSARHPNRYVREISQQLMGTMCDILDEERVCGGESRIREELGLNIGFGLSDNWSQVRYAASIAGRKFVMAATTEAHRALCLPLVLPQLCLNRHYAADGVRFYSQQTWQMALGEDGKVWVARCISTVVSYYVEQAKASNHMVREAACSCMSELVSKVQREPVKPHVHRLVACLLLSFRDASWPVRDAACLATGQCVLFFPDECRDVLEKLYKLWFAHLEDNVYSVREDSAVALGNAVRAYGVEARERVRAVLDASLLRAKEQESRQMRRELDQWSDQEQKDQLMSSCGSLVPKVRRGVDCCGDYGMVRPPEPWEASDGAIYMVRELAGAAPEDAVAYLPTLAELARLTDFPQHVNLHETLWKCLPDIATSVGKSAFKPALDPFLEPMFRTLCCGHALCETAARQCITRLSVFMGRPIFEGRLDSTQKSLFNGFA